MNGANHKPSRLGKVAQMILHYRNWPTAVLDRAGHGRGYPVVYSLREKAHLLAVTPRIDIGIINEIWVSQLYDHAAGWKIRNHWQVMDVGANKGYFTVRAAQRASKVVAVEPNPAAMAYCKANLLLNGLADRVSLVEAAVSVRKGTLELSTPQASVLSRIVDHNTPETGPTVRVSSTLMRDLVRETGDCQIDLLKMDIEGAEAEVLLDANSHEWLAFVSRLAMEYHLLVYSRDILEQLMQKLRSAGFAVNLAKTAPMLYAIKQ